MRIFPGMGHARSEGKASKLTLHLFLKIPGLKTANVGLWSSPSRGFLRGDTMQLRCSASPLPIMYLMDPMLGKGLIPVSASQCSCWWLLPFTTEEHSLHQGLQQKPGHESTCKSSDSDITRKLIFLPLSANKMLLPDNS